MFGWSFGYCYSALRTDCVFILLYLSLSLTRHYHGCELVNSVLESNSLCSWRKNKLKCKDFPSSTTGHDINIEIIAEHRTSTVYSFSRQFKSFFLPGFYSPFHGRFLLWRYFQAFIKYIKHAQPERHSERASERENDLKIVSTFS